MKVERKTEFTPITITIETEEEAKWMWACLNTSINNIQNSNEDEFDMKLLSASVKKEMFYSFDDKFDPTRK